MLPGAYPMPGSVRVLSVDELLSPSGELRWWRAGQAPVFAELLCGIWHRRPSHLISGSVLLTTAGHRGSPGKEGGSSVTEALRGGDARALTPGRRGDLMPAVSE